MRCFVFKSLRKADTYVYLAEREGAGRIPEPMRGALGELKFIMELDLVPGRRLAQEDPGVVRDNLASRGYHLQFPPPPTDWESNDAH
jgi:uncharacterized protein YcgL (UPF0745 family)